MIIKTSIISLLFLTLLSQASAAPYALTSNGAADGVASSIDVRGLTNDTPRSGLTASGTDASLSVVYVFELPDWGTDSIESVDFDFKLESKTGTPTFNVDLYGLGYRDAAAIAQSDFYAGAYDGDGTDATALADNVLVPSSSNGSVVNLTDDAGLLAYVNAQITAGAGAGDYLFLRLSPDFTIFPNENLGFNVYAGEATSAANRPVLTITTIPEPGTLGLMLISVSGLLLFRKRFR